MRGPADPAGQRARPKRRAAPALALASAIVVLRQIMLLKNQPSSRVRALVCIALLIQSFASAGSIVPLVRPPRRSRLFRACEHVLVEPKVSLYRIEKGEVAVHLIGSGDFGSGPVDQLPKSVIDTVEAAPRWVEFDWPIATQHEGLRRRYEQDFETRQSHRWRDKLGRKDARDLEGYLGETGLDPQEVDHLSEPSVNLALSSALMIKMRGLTTPVVEISNVLNALDPPFEPTEEVEFTNETNLRLGLLKIAVAGGAKQDRYLLKGYDDSDLIADFESLTRVRAVIEIMRAIDDTSAGLEKSRVGWAERKFAAEALFEQFDHFVRMRRRLIPEVADLIEHKVAKGAVVAVSPEMLTGATGLLHVLRERGFGVTQLD